RVIGGLAPLLVPPDGRANFAEFLTAELGETLNLDSAQREAVFSYIQNRLGRAVALQEAMKAIAVATPDEATEIKAMLLPNQERLFDQTYGADGLELFAYAKVIALGKIGP
ncbi:MAG TPA: hypothetical protein VH598_04615, partial [Verrucomicrobiae bacterium]|nr:hypothetical protein [Verrucomicrobiae bacterium]